MKKLFYVTLTLIMLLTSTSCQSKNPVDEKAVALYQDSFGKLTKLESAELYAKMMINYQYDLAKYRVKLEGDGRFINRDKNVQSAFSLSAAMNGIKYNGFMKFYTDHGVIYYDILDKKQKVNFDLSFLGSITTTDKEKTIKNTKKMLKKASIITNENGTKKIVMVFHPQFMSSYMSTLNSFTNDDAVIDPETIEFKKMKVITFLDKNERIKKIKLEMEFSLSVDEEAEDEDANYEIEMLFQVKNENKINSIDFPAFEDFIETSSQYQLPEDYSSDEYWGDLYDEGEDDSESGIAF